MFRKVGPLKQVKKYLSRGKKKSQRGEGQGEERKLLNDEVNPNSRARDSGSMNSLAIGRGKWGERRKKEGIRRIFPFNFASSGRCGEESLPGWPLLRLETNGEGGEDEDGKSRRDW